VGESGRRYATAQAGGTSLGRDSWREPARSQGEHHHRPPDSGGYAYVPVSGTRLPDAGSSAGCSWSGWV